MVKTMIKANYSECSEVDIFLDSTLNEIQINKGGYEELIIKLTEEQLQCLFTQMAGIGYNDLFMEKLWATEKKLEEAEDHIEQLKDRVEALE